MIFELSVSEEAVLRRLQVAPANVFQLVASSPCGDIPITQRDIGHLRELGLVTDAAVSRPTEFMATGHLYAITVAGKEHLNTPLRHKKPDAYQQASA